MVNRGTSTTEQPNSAVGMDTVVWGRPVRTVPPGGGWHAWRQSWDPGLSLWAFGLPLAKGVASEYIQEEEAGPGPVRSSKHGPDIWKAGQEKDGAKKR